MSDEAPDPIEAMNELHVDLGRKAAELAMTVLEQIEPADIPVATAVALLKFGVDLERKALGQSSEDGDGEDPFSKLAGAMTGKTPKKEEEDGPDR